MSSRTVLSLRDALLLARKYCVEPVCRPDRSVHHRGELVEGFVIESHDERDGVGISIDRTEVLLNGKRTKVLSLAFTLTWVRSRVPSGVVGVSPILVIPVEDLVDEVLVIKEGEVYQQVKPVQPVWNTTIFGKRAEVAIERYVEYPLIPEDIDDKTPGYYYVIRVTIE